MIEKKKNYLYNPFLIAFICFALISCLILSVLFLLMLHEQEKESTRLYYQEKADTMINDLSTQIEDLEAFSQRLIINEKYMYSTVFKEKYNERVLLDDFKVYRNFSYLTQNMFLHYVGCDHVFRAEGDTVITEVFFRHLSTDERNTLESVLNDPGDHTNIFLLSDSIYIIIPFKADFGLMAPKAVLGTVLSREALENRFELVCGRPEGNVALYQGDRLIYCSDYTAFAEGKNNTIVSANPDGELTLHYIPDNNTLYSLHDLLHVMLFLLVISAIVGLAILFADRVYKPLQEISDKYYPSIPVVNKSEFNNLYEEIEGILDTALQERLTAAVEVERKQELLKQQILKSLLNGTHIQDMEAYLIKLNITLPGPYFYVISVAFQQIIDEAFWNQLQEELKKIAAVRECEYLYTVGEYESKQMSIVCSLNDRDSEEDMSECIQEVVNSYGIPAVLGVGKVYEGLQRISASWLESVDNLYRKDDSAVLSKTEYSYKDLQWLADALSIGNEKVLLDGLNKYVQWIRENNKSMLMQLYLFSEFIGELARASRSSGVELSNHTISLVLSARTVDTFYEGVSAAIKEYCEKFKTLNKKRTDSKAVQICEYIQAHFMEYDLSLETIANKLNVPSVDVRTAVYNVSGKKYTDYVTSLRMEYAKKLMLEQKLSVADICEAVGYSSVSYFIRIFKETTGTTPAKFMKEIRTFKANSGEQS
jgi:YesN/AraC family two-component response regulator